MRRQSTFQEDPDLIVRRVRAWVEEVTGKELSGDFRECLQDGIVLCELMAKLLPGSIQRVNKLKSPIAHLDNIRSFLQACRVHFQLNEAQIFDVTDLQDPEQRCGAFTSAGKKGWDAEKRLKNVCVTLYWIGRILEEDRKYQGPLPDLSVFHPVLPGQSMSVPIPEDPAERSSHSPTIKSPVPPSVPSRPNPRLIRQAALRAEPEIKQEAETETMDLVIVPINSSFGFHLLSKPLEGTNMFVSTVHSVLEDSAADKAGLRRGDQFQMVNGMDTSYFSHQQIVKLVKDSAATSLAVKIRRKPLILSSSDSEPRGEGSGHSPPTRHFNSLPSPPAPQTAVAEEKSSGDSSPTKSASIPAHYVVDTEDPKSKYRAVPPPPPEDESIYVNQTILQQEGPGPKFRYAGKPRKSSPTKASPPKAQRGTLERESRAKKGSGGTEVKEQTLGAKTPRSHMPLPPPPAKDSGRAPNSAPTRRRHLSAPEEVDGSGSLKRGAGKAGCKVAVVESVDVSSPPARLENLSMEVSEDSGEEVQGRRSGRELASNRVSMSDPFRGILPVSDGRSLLDEIFPEGEESSLHSILPEESPLKSPTKSRPQPSREYFSKILHPQISQQEPGPSSIPVPVPVPLPEVRLRDERVRQSPARSSGSSERHSAKLVGSLLSGGSSNITPTSQDKKKQPEKRDSKLQNSAPPQTAVSLPQPPSARRPHTQVSAVTENDITQSLPQSYQPPHTSVHSSPTRHNTTQMGQQQVSVKKGVKGHIGRAKSFTGAHHSARSRDSSDERNFSSLMSGPLRGVQGGQKGEFPQKGTSYPQENSWGQRGVVQRGQSLRQPARHPGSMIQRQAQSETGVPPYSAQPSYPPTQLIRGAYPFHPTQVRFQTPQYQQQQQQPRPLQTPPNGHHHSKIFQISVHNAGIPCTSCGHPLGMGAAAGVHGKRNIYHPDCYRCEVCGGQLLESSYLLGEKLHCAYCKDSIEGSLKTVC